MKNKIDHLDYDVILHLSHIDLDGYGAQLVINNLTYDETCLHVTYNSNYGEEIMVRLQEMLDIDNGPVSTLFLITDLNLNEEQAAFIDAEIRKRDNCTLLLLDHHATGTKVAEKYDWYHLDTTKSGTMLTFEAVYGEADPVLFRGNVMYEFVSCVNAADLWLTNQKERFRLGRVLSDTVYKVGGLIPREMFTDVSTYFILKTLRKMSDTLLVDNPARLENGMLTAIRTSLLDDPKDMTLGEVTSSILSIEVNGRIFKDGDKPYKFTLNGVNLFIGCCLPSPSDTLNQILLDAKGEYDIAINVSSKGGISLRTLGHDCSKLASLLGGGGHVQASGAFIDNFTQHYIYKDFKEYFEMYLRIHVKEETI